jgi:hypothetical protein
LATLPKVNPLVAEARLFYYTIFGTRIDAFPASSFDIVNTLGVASDLSHISTPAKVEGYLPPDDGLKKTLTGANIVVIPAGVPRKPGVRTCFE